MKDTYNLSEFRSFTRVRQIAGGVILLLALTLAGPPRLWAQCNYPQVNASISPSSVFEGNPAVTLTVTITMSAALQVCDGNGGDPVEVDWEVKDPNGRSLYSGGFNMLFGQSSHTFTLETYDFGYTQPITATLTAGAWAAGPPGNPALLHIIPGTMVASPANLGVCPAGDTCKAGSPINLADGNVWISEQDYSVPGLGGGLQLSRVWNSRLAFAATPVLAGMFGSGWRSTYEEQLTPLGSGSLMYWRGDGGGWTFTYNSGPNSYSVSSPPNVRAQLVSNPSGGFTITFADGTQKVFNTQNLLAALIDRNQNQTTLAYDSYNRLTSVASPGGSTLTFTYGDPNNPMQVTTAQDSVGTVATYIYGNSSQLSTVIYPDGSAFKFTYDPNSNISTVTDSLNNLLESHLYDSQGRGLTSTRAYGVDSVSLTY